MILIFLIDLLIRDLSYVKEYYIKDKAKDALDFLRNYKKPLACIFVDIKMPEMDGFEFVHEYEEELRNKFPDTHIFFVTSSVREADRSRAMAFLSVKEVILKPLTRTKLKEIYDSLGHAS